MGNSKRDMRWWRRMSANVIVDQVCDDALHKGPFAQSAAPSPMFEWAVGAMMFAVGHVNMPPPTWTPAARRNWVAGWIAAQARSIELGITP